MWIKSKSSKITLWSDFFFQTFFCNTPQVFGHKPSIKVSRRHKGDMFSGRAEASYVQFNSLCLKSAPLIWPPSRLVHLWLSLGCKICEPSKAGVAVGAAGCFQCFYLFPDFNTSSFSMNQDLTQQADSGAVAFLFWPVLMESWSISSVVVIVVSVCATGGYFLFRRLCLPVFLGAASLCWVAAFSSIMSWQRLWLHRVGGGGGGENGHPLCWQGVLMWMNMWKVIFVGLWRSNSSYRNDAFALISLFPLHWKKTFETFCH